MCVAEPAGLVLICFDPVNRGITFALYFRVTLRYRVVESCEEK